MIETMAANFRHAIECAKANRENRDYFRKFPSGQCGTTSDMLAQYFIDNACDDITYVNGTYYGNTPFENQSHTWLEINNLVIDITGDQFKYHSKPLKYDIPIYIGPMNEYYKQFVIQPGGAHKHFGLDASWLNYYELLNCYKIIKNYL